MNAFGIDVRNLDVEAFLLWSHRLYPGLALLWIGALLRFRRPVWLLAGVLLANAWLWTVIHYPLQQIYALSSSPDRVNQLGMIQAAATGHQPLIGPQVGQLDFEPFWSFFVAALSGFEPERVLVLYPFLSLFPLIGFAASLYYALRPGPGLSEWSPWERALIAGAATLLVSSPLEYAGTYRTPWALMFLLKPNHALGLVLLPWLLRSFATIQGWRGRLGAGFLLHLLGWVFVLHMVYVAAGLVLFALVSWWSRAPEARRDILDSAGAIGISLLIVCPYVLILVVDYPFMQSSPRLVIPPDSAHLAEGTLRHTPLLLLGGWGTVVAWRRDRMGRVWASTVVAGLLIWLAYPIVGWLQLARERDEIYYWVRFTVAAMAGVGAWELGRRILELLGTSLPELRRAALIALVALPFTIPAWWDPARMDAYFVPSLEPLDGDFAEPTRYVRRETPREAVFTGDQYYSRWVAALGARRGLSLGVRSPSDNGARLEFAELVVTGADRERRDVLAPRWGATHLVVTREFLERFPGVTVEQLAERPDLELLLHHRRPANYVAIFRLRPE